ncbi:MAG TPA: heme ABC exporter ATP-binding protein CcmA [Xanthobacteraceae bacterium]|jgi:heme exporter protein A|nr:heme ABC exporter ATP-binding protein CcmA [Xanthobacteraceae bacterium]
MRLRTEQLSCVRGGRSLFRDLSFELAAGEALAVTGPNGAGKTSLLRIIAGLLSPAGGRVALEDGGLPLNESCHFVSHYDGVKGALTVMENLSFFCALLGGATDGKRSVAPAAALSRLGLGALGELPAYVLSAGQKRRLALSKLLAAPRPIWLLDEPTAALDVTGKEVLLGMIGEHRARGGMVVVATHLDLELEDAREIFISNGRAV